MKIYWWFAIILDAFSTLAFCEKEWEENPIFANAWNNYGSPGFIILAFAIGLLGHFAILLIEKYVRLKNIIYVCLFFLITFKVLIALTNMVLIPYWITGWFNF